MEAISAIGFLVFLGSLVYLLYHFIRKIKDRQRRIPKKRFYSALIGGFIVFLVGGTLTDTSIQDQLNEVLEVNAVLASENDDYKSSYKSLEGANQKLKEEMEEANKELEEANKEIEQLNSKIKDYDQIKQDLADQKSIHKEKKESLENEIINLKETNSELTSEVDKLKKQVANKNTSSTASSSGTSSNKSSSSTTNRSSSSSSSSVNSTQSSGNVYYKNCTAARAAGAAPVYRGEPGYGKHLDRDGDGIGCE